MRRRMGLRGSSPLLEGDKNLLQAQINHNTQRLDQLVLDMQDVKNKLGTLDLQGIANRLDALEKIPVKRLDAAKLIVPVLAIMATIMLGTLGLEISTLFFVLQHIAAH